MIWPWSATSRYIAHMEAEIELLRQQVFAGYRPPPQQKPDREPPPQSLVEVCDRFESHGKRLLAQAMKEHRREGTSYAEIENRILAHIAQHANNGGEP